MNATRFYTEQAGGGLLAAEPARIACYPEEGDGEWTIEAQDSSGAAIRDERGGYLAVWHDEEALDDFLPMDRDGAVAEAAWLAREMGLPMLPVYVVEDDGTMTLVVEGVR